MAESFGAKLTLALKVLSLSRGRLAANLGVDKSIVGRWSRGVIKPSSHNLTRLTALIAERVSGFTVLDWDRSFADFAAALGADPRAVAGFAPPPLPGGLPLAILDQVHTATALRGAAYEGFFRSTRPYILAPGRFVHDHAMVRRDPASGLLALKVGTAGTFVEGWVLPVLTQVICIAADVTSGAMLFGIFNGVGASRAELIDGLSLGSALDAGRTPTAYAMIFERVGDLTDDPEADERHFQELAASNPLAPEGSISQELQDHLLRDIGPAQFALGGDLLLQMPLIRSLSRGPAYRAPPEGG